MARHRKKSKKKSCRPKLIGEYSQTPNKLARSGKAMGQSAKVVYLALNSYDPSYPSYDILESDTGYSRPIVANAIKELVRVNIIAYEKGNSFKKANEYTFKHPNEWKLGKKVNQSKPMTTTGKKERETSKLGQPKLRKKLNSKKTNTEKPRERKPNKETNNIKDSLSILNGEIFLFNEFKYLFKETTGSNYSSSGDKEIQLFRCSLIEMDRSVEDIQKAMKNYFKNPYFTSYSVGGILSDTNFNRLLTWQPSKKDIIEHYQNKRNITLSEEELNEPLSTNTLYKTRLYKIKDGVARIREAYYVESLQLVHRGKVHETVEKYIRQLEV